MPDTKGETELLRRRFEELAQRAYKTGLYCYTEFLSTAEQALLISMKKQLSHASFSLWGGVEACERRMAAFGSAELCGGEHEWPQCCLLVSPRSRRFAETLGHRDYLGALMNLGIERGVVGDIVVRDEGAYLFCTRGIAPFIADNLEQIKHTSIFCTYADSLPEGELYSRHAETVQVSSPRADALVSRAYKLSREASLELFRAKKIFINSALCENNSRTLETEDIVSVRGYGRFAFCGVQNTSKKGKLNVRIEKFGDSV